MVDKNNIEAKNTSSRLGPDTSTSSWKKINKIDLKPQKIDNDSI
jgi:hypothetical protein